MTDEYYTAVTTFHLTWPEIVTLGRNSLMYSFAYADLKARMIREYEQSVSAFEKKFGEGDWRATVRAVHPLISGYAQRTWGIQ